jgi:isoleucyl-tRNA synthetase
MDVYDPNKAVKIISNFVNEDLSNWYIRRNRRRFWGSKLDTSKKAVYQTTYEVLCGLCKLIAPFVPFVSEEIYTSLTNEKSVHLTDYPKFDKNLVDEKIETKMDLVRDLISLGRNAREEAKIKVRQPISEVILDNKVKKNTKDLEDLIYEELNVKEIKYVKDLSLYMTFSIKPNFKVCGPIFGSNIKQLSEALNNLSQDEIIKLSNGEEITIKLDKEYTLNQEMVDIRINSKEGFNAASSLGNFIILDTTLTKELINEGIARELISKVQQMRKNKDFDIVDRIKLYYEKNDEFKESIKDFIEMIKQETLSTEIIEKANKGEELDLNGLLVKIDIERNKK